MIMLLFIKSAMNEREKLEKREKGDERFGIEGLG